MMENSSEENLYTKEAYEWLLATYGNRVCTYRADIRQFTDTLFRETVQTYIHQISYCGVVSHNQNKIVDHSIKEFTLGIWTILLHATRVWKEAVSKMLLPFSFKAVCQKYNSLDIGEDRKTSEHKFSGIQFQNFRTDYHTWGCPVFVLEPPCVGRNERAT